ncbi:MAG TPA: amino acid adenylation domain-containing protein [Pyrinomonadaceae bacterium]|nr:amino acid adenylation domain-containing protein [Pyrinomonadaceae bacterium]
MSTAINLSKGSIPARITNLSPQKRELLEKLLAIKGVEMKQSATLSRRARPASVPLSFAQQRLWVLHQLDPGNPSYNMPEAVRFVGPLDTATFEKSLDEIVRRHEVLRTTFRTTEHSAEQIIAPAQPVNVSHLDLSALPESEREAEAARLTAEEAMRPFDLANGPVLRVSLLRLAPEDQIILFTMHHIASDVWSMGVLVKELMALYSAFAAGQPSPLPELPIQYADYAIWQHECSQLPELAQHLEYWKKHLSGAPAALDLPADRPRPAVMSFHGAVQRLALPAHVSASLISLSRQENCTLFMTLLAAFQTLLHRYTGQVDLVVGTPMAGRNRSEIEGLIGFFVNTLVLRTDLTRNPSFKALLARVREVALGAAAHQDLPFEKLVEELQPERDLSRTPLFQVMFALQNVRTEALALPDLQVVHAGATPAIAKFDLTLFMSEANGEIGGTFEYNTDLFDDSTIRRMIEHFQRLVEGIAANPDQRLLDLPLLTDAERYELLVKFNDTSAEYPSELCVHQLLEQQVLSSPATIAVAFKNERLTYQELNARANKLAHHLRSLGVGPEVPVTILMRRSVEMVVALLGVLKAGGAYLPLDPSNPRERLAAVLDEAQVSVVLTQEQLGEWERFNDLDSENLHCSTRPENLAYVIFTSGSTGKPKGAMIPHRGLVNYLSWCTKHYAVADGYGAPVHSPLGFDLTVTSLLAPLLAGRTVELLPEEEGVESLGQSLRADRDFSLVKITPAHLEVLRNMFSDGSVPGTRAFIIGGEALFDEHTVFWQQRAPGTRLINEYGPTETVVGCCIYEVPEGSSNNGAVPIGRPIANAQLYLLDQEMQPVPTGVTGELYIGGDGLARGYLNRPDATAEKFVPHPFATNPGERLYKTGDLARFLGDGNLEYLGRIDNQVKIRGFRIELGEVESVLVQHPAVRETVVTIREDVPGDKRLVAYVTAAAEQPPAVTDLRLHLRDKLPAYMIPSAIVVLDALPLTTNGKIDHQSLPAPDETGSDRANSFVAPRNLMELQLAEMWEEILNVHPIGLTDNFFDLGGHSILGLRLMARIQKQFDLDLPLATLFEGGTVEHLASIIRQRTVAAPTHLVNLQQGGSRQPIFFMHPIGGGIVCYAYVARRLAADRPVYALAAYERDDPHARVETMAAAYIEEMRRVQPHGPYLLGGWSFGGFVALETARQLSAMGEEIALLAILDCEAPGLADEWQDGEQPVAEDDPMVLAQQLEIIANRKDALQIDEQHLRQLSYDEQLLYIMELAKAAHIMPPELNLAQVKRSIRNLTTRVHAGRNYLPPVYPGKITLFRCTDVVPRYQPFLETDPTWGWKNISSQPIDLHLIPGAHETIVVEPNVQVLAERLEACIASLEME